MIAINICFQFKNNFFNEILKINKSIKDNIIDFDKYIPHITILQFYTNKNNLIEIKKKIKSIKYNINNFVIKNSDLKIEKYKNKNIYSIKIESEEFNLLFDRVFNDFKGFIEYSKDISREFVENIKYKILKDIVSNYYKTKYSPHITVGICEQIQKITFKDIIVEKQDLEIDLFYIGDYGVAIPINTI